MSLRVEALTEAARLTGTDRNKEYGPPTENLDNTALLWSAYLQGKYGGLMLGDAPCRSEFSITSEDVAWFNVLQKISRTFTGQVKADTYIDAAAYSAIALECAMDNNERLEGDE